MWMLIATSQGLRAMTGAIIDGSFFVECWSVNAAGVEWMLGA